MNPPPWWSQPWWSWVLTIVLAAIVAGLAVPAIKAILSGVWKMTLHRPFVLMVSCLKAGRLECGHRSGSYATYSDGTRACMKCHATKLKP